MTIVCGKYGHVHIFGNDGKRNTKPGTIQIMEGSFDNEQVVMASVGRGHKACITAEGMWTWGSAEYCELGHGDCKKIERPHIIHKSMLGESAAVMVACGIHHMLVLTARKVVWSCGWGHYSQLCHGDKEDHEKLTQNILANIAMVACGGTYSMAVDTQGQLFSWGDNNDDQLGHNDFTNRTLPKMLPSEAFAGDAVELVSAGKFHAAAVTIKGTLYVWGSNRMGQLGMNSIGDIINPTLLPAFEDWPASSVSCCLNHTMVV